MKKVYEAIDALIDYAEKNLCLDKRNEDYVRNDIFRTLSLDSYTEETGATSNDETPERLTADLAKACIEAGIFEDWQTEQYIDTVMGALMLMPNALENHFNLIKDKEDSKSATEWFYTYCVKGDYVKKAKLDANPRFDADNGLVVTINKAKPEFRDAKKAQSGNATKGGYPKCSICHANEGFAGRSKRTLRTVNLTLGGQNWFWQFSPYGYFYQHGIAVNYEHTPMHVDKGTFTRLMDFVDQFPHYFIGSNAALPRIGGSVLAHDHYQGGGEILPMHKAKAWKMYSVKGYDDAIIEIVDWPGTVVRVVSENRSSIEDICEEIRKKWVSYENRELEIIPEDEEGIHSAVSPTVVKTARGYEMSIILRSNCTNETYPDGIFHAHPEFHVIKKESIGLIEAQGLFILPGRLEAQLGEIENMIVEGKPLSAEYSEFELIYNEIIALCNGNYQRENVNKAIKDELASVCYRILGNTAVFKDKSLTEEFIKEWVK